MILVVCALREELSDFAPPAHVRVCAVGVGPVESAIGTARELARVAYGCVLSAGIGGAFRPGLRVGEAALIVADALADFGLEGGAALQLPGGRGIVEAQAADATLARRCAGLGVPSVGGLTVTSVTTTDATAHRLHARYGAQVETMETFAVFRAAAAAGVPALGVRGISNYVGDRRNSQWDFRAGAGAAIRALRTVLEHLETEA